VFVLLDGVGVVTPSPIERIQTSILIVSIIDNVSWVVPGGGVCVWSGAGAGVYMLFNSLLMRSKPKLAGCPSGRKNWSIIYESVAHLYIFSPFDLGLTWEHQFAYPDSDQHQGRNDLAEDSCLARHVLRTGSVGLCLLSTLLRSSSWRMTLS
jgi:hypothetical protein